MDVTLEKIDDVRWRIPKTGAMRVPGMIFASGAMLPKIKEDKAVEQVANYARANRQTITHWVREAFMTALSMRPKDLGMDWKLPWLIRTSTR